MPERDLYRAFVIAWNGIVKERKILLPIWQLQIDEGTPLERLRAGQMIEITEQPPFKNIIPELTQLVLERVVINNITDIDFFFMDGTERKVTL